MAIDSYSVLKGNVVDFKEERDNDAPHFQIKVDVNGSSYRVAVNVLSAADPSVIKYMVVNDFFHTITDKLRELPDGMHAVESKPNSMALDFIRGNLFDIEDMKLMPHTKPGPDNDLNDLLKMYSERAQRQDSARIFAFGEKWPKSNGKDRYFGFSPQQGIHDIHMNQGNSGKWKQDNGVYQDGGLFFYFPDNNQWVGVFLAFQSQAIHTDDLSGDPIGTQEQLESTGKIKIIAALVNPAGDDRGKETVTLLNISNENMNLNSWKLLDHREVSHQLPNTTLNAGDTIKIALPGSDMQLSNKGGQITLLNPYDLKIDGVTYTKDQVKKQGWTLVF